MSCVKVALISQYAENFTNDDFENLRNAGFEAIFEDV
jgi:hypothetical protein